MPEIKLALTSKSEPDLVLRRLGEPSEPLFKNIPGIVSFRDQSGLGVYEAKIRLRRFLKTDVYTLGFTAKREGDRVVYESLEPGVLRAVLQVSGESGATKIDLEIFYNTPLNRSAVESIFRKLIENIDRLGEKEEEGFKELEWAGIAGSEPIKAVSCKTCLLYEASTGICAYYMKKIEDPEEPICKGDKYIKASGPM